MLILCSASDRAFDGDGDGEADPEHDDETAFGGDGELSVGAAPTLVHEGEGEAGEEHRVGEDEPAYKRIEGMPEHESEHGKEEPERKGYAAVIDPDLRLAGVVDGLDGIVFAELDRVYDEHDRRAKEIDDKPYGGDCRRDVVFDGELERSRAHRRAVGHER